MDLKSRYTLRCFKNGRQRRHQALHCVRRSMKAIVGDDRLFEAYSARQSLAASFIQSLLFHQ